MSKTINLKILQDEVASCVKCGLHTTRTQTVFARGNSDSPIVFLGEGPGFHEDQQGLPFVGRSGKLLDNMIRSIGFDPAEVYICNIVKCRPPNNRKPELNEMDSCKPYLVNQLDIVSPRVIVALGATAAEGILGKGLGITKRRGIWGTYNSIPVMPTYHPSYCLRNPASKKDVWVDLQEVMRFIKEKNVGPVQEGTS